MALPVPPLPPDGGVGGGIMDALESAVNPITEVPKIIDITRYLIRNAWDDGITEAVKVGELAETSGAEATEVGGAVADLFASAEVGVAVAGSIISLVGILVLLILLLVAVAIVTLHRQIHHIADSIPLVGGTLAGWEDDAYGVIQPIFHGIEQQLINELVNFFLDARKLVQFLYGIDPLKLAHFLEHWVSSHIKGLVGDIAHLSDLIHWIQVHINPVLSHLWSNVHALWSRLTQLEGLIQFIQETLLSLQHLIDILFSDIHDLWDFVEGLALRIAHVLDIANEAEHDAQRALHELSQIRAVIVTIEDRIAFLDGMTVPVSALAAVAFLLTPLLDAGVEGVENLAKTADGECICPPDLPNLDPSQCDFLQKIISAAGHKLHA